MAKILLVEDDNNLREIYEARLMAEGYDIVSARDGEEALSVAIKEKPDLVISDVMMPKISGFDMLDILRTTEETKNVKVIMMTALSQAEDKARAEKLGADKYLVKSQVTLEDVAKVAKEVLESGPKTSADTPLVASTPTPDPTTAVAPAPDPTPAVPAPVVETPAEEPATPPVEEPVAVPAAVVAGPAPVIITPSAQATVQPVSAEVKSDRKIIEPIVDPMASTRPSINELLAKEEAKEQMAVNSTQDANVVHPAPVAEPTDGVDPNSIAL